MIKRINIFLFLFIVLISSRVNAQVKDSCINIWEVETNLSFHLPGADMAKRFGLSTSVGVGLTYKTKKNWTFGFEGSYIFGKKIKAEDSKILDGLKTKSGEIINIYGEYAIVQMYERGFYTGVKAGKVFPVFSSNSNSGIVFNIGAGFLQHHIRIENEHNNTPPVLGDYKKGYDRLSNGIAFREFIGYKHLSNNRLINFYVGLEFYQGFTQGRRPYNFDTMEKDDSKRTDLLSGIRFGWILPLYSRQPDEYYFH